jgi:hypothetical protein
MARGLSELQKSILEMAYERFLEDERKENEYGRRQYPNNPRWMYRFDGTSYTVDVGPLMPTGVLVSEDHGLDYLEAKDRLIKQRMNPFADPDKQKDAVEAQLEEELAAASRRISDEKRQLEERVKQALPQLWVEPEDAYYVWSPPRWSYHSGGSFDGGGMSYQRFELATFHNNAWEARRYKRLLKDAGLASEGGYSWHGGGYLYTSEILKDAFGFEPKYNYEHLPPEWGGQRNAIKFDPQDVGERRYNAARASVSRSLKRLYDRMLIERSRNYGLLTITLEGIAALTGQTVKELCETHKINRSDGDKRLLIRGEPELKPSQAELAERGEVLKGLQESFHGAPPLPLADMFDAAISEHMLYYQGKPSVEEIEEAIQQAIERSGVGSEAEEKRG